MIRILILLSLSTIALSAKITPSPINLNTFSAKVKKLPKLVIGVDASEILNVKNTGRTMTLTPTSTPSRSNTTGGPFGNDTYLLYKINFFWSPDPTQSCCERINGHSGFPLKANIAYMNSKYESNECFKYRDCILILNFVVNIDGKIPNPYFETFFESFQKVLKPGTETTFSHYSGTHWFSYILDNISTYYAYQGEYDDDKSGKRYYVATNINFEDNTRSFLSIEQYLGTFLRLQEYSGAAPTSVLQSYPQYSDTIVIQSQGVVANLFNEPKDYNA